MEEGGRSRGRQTRGACAAALEPACGEGRGAQLALVWAIDAGAPRAAGQGRGRALGRRRHRWERQALQAHLRHAFRRKRLVSPPRQ
eukprot:2937472-Alexandrium_andersonii.AAC.1